MKINGTDIRAYNAKQLTADVQPPSIMNNYEWLSGATLPTELETDVQMGHLKLSIYFKGKDRNSIIRSASEFMMNFTKPCRLELDGYESTARVQVGALGSYSTTSSGMLKSKEFTTIEREITVSEGTKYIYIYAYTQNAPVYITDIEVLGLYSLYADAKIQVTAEEITSEVKKKVNSDDFGTLITQNAYNVRVAFNNGSSYMQFDSTGITMYTGTITDNTKRTRFDYNGEHFYRDGKYVGKIGTNTMIGNDSQRGLVFDIEYDTAYMSWANKESTNGSSYMMKWAYCTQQCNNYEANMLHAGADINMHYYKLRNVSFEDGAINGTLTFKQPLAVSSDGTLSKWSTATLTFKNGILISGAWSNG